ncbi:MAG TPA: peroxidase family protein [Vicinamibacterales bacterium]
MSEDLIQKITGLLRKKQWYELPRNLALARLGTIRNELRQKNLHDTEEPPLEKKDPATADATVRAGRTVDGTYDDLTYPAMGSVGRRFGRNFPLDQVKPDTANLMNPSPRVVSRTLMTREQFQPATILNLLAGAWIQFMVHDWFVHKRSATQTVDIPLAPGDDWSDKTMTLPRTEPDPAPAGSTRPPAYANLNSHWWDASMLYGCNADVASKVRAKVGGKLRIEPTGLLPTDPETGVSFSGFTDNWWIGLAMLHTLFTLEHNYIADLLAHQNPNWTDEQIFVKARLINSALMAKIHTVDWTPAILPNPITYQAMHINWSGLVGEDAEELAMLVDDSEALGGIVGSKHDHHTAPYSLTEEFVSVYRMHPLMPDEIAFRSLATGRLVETLQLPDVTGRKTPGVAERHSMPDLFYSFGVSHPGAVTLHNYPKHLQNLTRDDGEHLDLAAVDIFRDRERGVPRYNQFRRLLHKDPVKSFDELTDNPVWRKQIKDVYGDIEKVDLMTGLYAEPLPPGFGFSDTAFRVFILMASRRLKSDRFFTDDWTPAIYTEFGLNYIRTNSMLSVLRRHFPQLAPALAGVTNAFAPWKAVTPPVPPGQ